MPRVPIEQLTNIPASFIICPQVDVTYITLQFVGLLCLNNVVLVRQASPVVQVVPVVHIADQGLALLGQYHPQHVHWAAILSLPFLKVLLVLPVTLDLGYVHGPHHLGVIFDVPSPNMVAQLLAVAIFVFVLK